jgi:hypothetical protein
MKTYLIILMLGASTPLLAQKIDSKNVPASVKNSLNQNFGVTIATWDKEGEDYEANFKVQGKKASVVFSPTGIILETENTIDQSSLPASVKTTLEKDYAGYKIEEAEKITSKGVIQYEAKVEKGEKSFELLFDVDGKLLKKEEEHEDKKKE